jgi:AraC-like DNA-binding protein
MRHYVGASLSPDIVADECKSDRARVVLPSTHVHLVVRIGRHLPRGFDIHAMGPRYKAHRKLILGGQRTLIARLPLGTYRAVLGRPASELAGHIVALRDLWDSAAAQRLEEQLAATRDTGSASNSLKAAIAERIELGISCDTNTRLVQRAARCLESRNVTSVAESLGVSDRHLRRAFREVVGLSPKAYFKLMRFERALNAARDSRDLSWSDIAVGSGYYDQAHLIADFRSIAGATPREFLAEVRRDS